MIRGRYLKQNDAKKVLERFPDFHSDDWDESTKYSQHSISIWDKWLIATETPDLLGDATKEDEISWQSKFRKLHELILDNTCAYVCYFIEGELRLKKIDSSKHVLDNLERNLCRILLPDLKTIYSVEFDFTSRVFFQTEPAKKLFDSWVLESDLKYIKCD